jgi:MoaA/NifB/PqqE/SkfB family radical SAM enzyme
MKEEELPTEFWKKTISSIRQYIGPYCIRFYGGEPFCRKDLLELLDYCSERDVITSITTNGTLIDQKIAKSLVKSRVSLINISLDGNKPETHDDLRGKQGTYAKVMRALECLRGKIPVHLNTTFMQPNLDEILDLAEFAKRQKFLISFQGYFSDNYARANVDQDISRDVCIIDRDNPLVIKDYQKAEDILDELCRMKRVNKLIIDSESYLQRLKLFIRDQVSLQKQPCEAIGARLMILNQGDITLCSYGGPLGSIGNLQKQSFKEIWRSSAALGKISRMKQCPITQCLVDRGSCRESYLEKIHKIKHIFFT